MTRVVQSLALRTYLYYAQIVLVVLALKNSRVTFLLAGTSQDVFLLPHIPWQGRGVVH